MELGLGAEAIRYRVKVSRLISAYAGVYAVGHLPTLPQHRAVGALLACGPEAVLSHGSAAAMWGISQRWEAVFEVTAPSLRRRRGILLHRGALEPRDVRRHLGIRVTSPARTLLDVTPRMTDRGLRRAVNDLLRQEYLRLHHLEDVLNRFSRNAGTLRLRPFLDPPDGSPTRSHIEDDYLAFSQKYGLPVPQVNVWIAGREVDAWYPEERVIVEIDSWEYHRDRDSFERDREKDAAALALGIETIRLTKRRMRDTPEQEAERVLSILRARRLESGGRLAPDGFLRPSETDLPPSR